MDMSVEEEERDVSRSVPTSETSSKEQDRSQVILKAMFNGKRLMIIELRKYNKVRELHIENGTAGSQAQVSYRGVIRRASVTKAAVRMGVTETGM